jgi:hypothetical protein
MDQAKRTNPNESTPERSAADRDREAEQQRSDEQAGAERPIGQTHASNPPRTTTGRMTSPKFGSATSGGGEIEPGPERD